MIDFIILAMGVVFVFWVGSFFLQILFIAVVSIFGLFAAIVERVVAAFKGKD